MARAVVGALRTDSVALVATEASLTLAHPSTVLLQWVSRAADSMTRAEVELSRALRDFHITSLAGPIRWHAVAGGGSC
jgi:hypothetical protein